ncbi:uncharacterized protein TNCV_2732451 [Trichonephila clavipes]|nr:uncharacterized protein TNCV_2732451 [Trichonephila clavipes]
MTLSDRHQDSRLRVWWHRGECTLTASIRHRHTDPSPGLMVWGAFGKTFQSPVVCIEDTLYRARYISGVLRPALNYSPAKSYVSVG